MAGSGKQISLVSADLRHGLTCLIIIVAENVAPKSIQGDVHDEVNWMKVFDRTLPVCPWLTTTPRSTSYWLALYVIVISHSGSRPVRLAIPRASLRKT